MPDDFEALDEDNLRLDPLEEGMDPPEHWAQADKFGNTEREAREGQDLDHRLAEEQPDLQPEDPDRPPGRLDDSVDDDNYDDARLTPEEPVHPHHTEAERSGTSADEAGGSIAEELRTPPGES
jgi:hypothetical protein